MQTSGPMTPDCQPAAARAGLHSVQRRVSSRCANLTESRQIKAETKLACGIKAKYLVDMKTNKIIRKQSVNGNDMWTLTFEGPVCGFDHDQAGNVLNSMDDQISVTSTDLEVGDSITDEFGGQPVIGEVHGPSEESYIVTRKQNDYRDAFQNKRHI